MSPELRTIQQIGLLKRQQQLFLRKSLDAVEVNRRFILPAVVEFEIRRTQLMGLNGTLPPERIRIALEGLLAPGPPLLELGETHLLEHHALLTGEPSTGWRVLDKGPLLENHQTLPPRALGRALARFFEWVRSPGFAETHPAQQMTIAQLRLYEIWPFEEHSFLAASLFSAYFPVAAGYLLPLPHEDDLLDFREALASAFEFTTAPLAELNLRACLRSYEKVLQALD